LERCDHFILMTILLEQTELKEVNTMNTSEIIDIIDALSTTEVIIQCGFCRGKGELSFGRAHLQPAEACPICNGKGKLLIKAQHLPLVACARCRGTGSTFAMTEINEASIQTLIDRVCPSCYGTGCQALVGEWHVVNAYENGKGRAIRTIHLTGISATEAADATRNETKVINRCFICHRAEGQANVYYEDSESEVSIAKTEIFKLEKQVGQVIITYPVCAECGVLFDLLQ